MRIIFLKIILWVFIFFTIAFIVWYSNVGSENLYYIEEADMYIKTFPERETTIIAFSDKKINKFSDTLDYIKVYKGINYGTGVLLDPNKKDLIYISGNSLIEEESHLLNYKIGKEISLRDTAYFECKKEGGYLLKAPYIEISFSLYGATEKVSLKNRENIFYTKIKPIK